MTSDHGISTIVVARRPRIEGSTEDSNPVSGTITPDMRDPIVVDSHEPRVTTRIGTAIHPEDGDALSRNADVATYLYMREGRGNHQRLVAPCIGAPSCEEGSCSR